MTLSVDYSKTMPENAPIHAKLILRVLKESYPVPMQKGDLYKRIENLIDEHGSPEEALEYLQSKKAH